MLLYRYNQFSKVTSYIKKKDKKKIFIGKFLTN